MDFFLNLRLEITLKMDLVHYVNIDYFLMSVLFSGTLCQSCLQDKSYVWVFQICYVNSGVDKLNSEVDNGHRSDGNVPEQEQEDHHVCRGDETKQNINGMWAMFKC